MSALTSYFINEEGSLINWIPEAIYTEQSNHKANSTSETFTRWSCFLRHGGPQNSFGSHIKDAGTQ